LRDKGITLLIVEHDMELIMDISDYITVMSLVIKSAKENQSKYLMIRML